MTEWPERSPLEARREVKHPPLADRDTERARDLAEEDAYTRIRCPLCNWQPSPSSVWYCASVGPPEHFSEGCGTAWNTFSTRGRCPGCSHQWRWTSCLRCDGWSLHEHWYERGETDRF